MRTALHRPQSVRAVGNNYIGPGVIGDFDSVAEFRARKERSRTSYVESCNQDRRVLARCGQISFQIHWHTLREVMRSYGNNQAVEFKYGCARRAACGQDAVITQGLDCLLRPHRSRVQGMIVGYTGNPYVQPR